MDERDRIKALKKASREIHKGMPKGGRHGPPKGKKGYTRKVKHKNRPNEARERGGE